MPPRIRSRTTKMMTEFEKKEAAEQMNELRDLDHEATIAGVPKLIREGVEKRVRAKLAGTGGELRPLTEKELIDKIESRIHTVLSFLDPYVMAGASAKDLSSSLDYLIKNAQLLKGKPTQIMSHVERRQLNELIPEIMREAKRRGVIIDVVPTEIMTPHGPA